MITIPYKTDFYKGFFYFWYNVEVTRKYSKSGVPRPKSFSGSPNKLVALFRFPELTSNIEKEENFLELKGLFRDFYDLNK